MAQERTATSEPIKKEAQARPENASSSQKKKRTFGNVMFDLIVWPTIAFGVVFAFSVWLLKTTKFGKAGAGGFKDRYDKWVKSMTEWMGKQQSFSHLPADELATKAEHYVDVLISFGAGTILVSPIKLFEDQRQSFAKAIDKLFGTTPKDPTQYKEEPKQSWLSVLGGRVLTFGIILGVSTTFGRKIDQALEATSEFFVGGWKALNPNVSAKTAEQVSQWSFVTAFEVFYTAVTTSLLYVISRAIAKKPGENAKDSPSAIPTVSTITPVSKVDSPAQEGSKKPKSTITAAEHHALVHEPASLKATV